MDRFHEHYHQRGLQAEQQRNLNQNLADIQAKGSAQGYANAQQQFNADQARAMQAQQANQQAGLTTGLQNLNALLGIQQLGAGQNLQSQLANQQATSADITNAQQPATLSQVVFTVALVGTSMTSISAGTVYFNVNYTQADGQIGSTTAYPYGNFD